MDPRKQLAQRLYFTPSSNPSGVNKSFQRRSESTDRKRVTAIPLTPKMLTSFRTSKPVKLEPISPHIKNKITGHITVDTSFNLEDKLMPFQASTESSKLSSIKVLPKLKEKNRAYVHGDSEFPMSAGPGSSGKSTSPFEILHMIKYDPDLADDFWYLNRKEDPYDFEFVTYQKRDPNQYLTISSRGVTYFMNGTTEFLTLEEWDREYKLYQHLKKINFFKQYKKWKNFSLWKNLRRRSMIKDRAEFLKTQLFILDDILREPLLNLRTQTYRIMRADIIDLSTEDVRTIKQFNLDQNTKREKVAELLEEIEGNIKSLIAKATTDSMDQFQKENRTTIQNQDPDAEENQESFLIGDNTNKQMPYTQEAIIRTHYLRLTKYIRLCDYQIIDSKVSLSHQSTQKILNTFKSHEEARVMKARGSRKAPNPLLSIFCNFEDLTILFDPTSEDIKQSLEDALMKGITVVCNNELLISASDFEKFTMMLEDFEDRQFEEELDLLQMVINDEHIRHLDSNIKESIERAFGLVVDYSDVFTPQLLTYQENENMDIDFFRTAELEEFKKAIDKYKAQIQEFNLMKETETVGIYQLNSKNLKEKLKPNPKRCLHKLEILMPELSLERSSMLLSELNDANRKLVSAPKAVEDYIEYAKFLKATIDRMGEFSQRFSDTKDLNQLMEMYNMRLDDALKSKFSDCLQALSLLRQRVQTASERDEGDRIKFSKELRDRIISIDRKVKEVNEKLKDDRISDKESQSNMVVMFLKDIGTIVEDVFNSSKAYSSYQDELEIERTNFDYVAEMKRDFKLKNDMWTALYEWSSKIVTWNSTPFKLIDVEQIGKDVDNYYRIAMRSRILEDQGNYVPDLLRSRVEELKNTMPVVVDLRSPALQNRHWDQIKDVLERDIDISDTTFTLQSLLDMKVNDKKDEISDIALKAKKEQELERQLNEVIKTWESVEFQLKYNKEKDVHTLTQLEDIIILLEDTQVQISSIITNRFVGPLYDKVDPWQKKFALFSATLDEWMNVQKQWLYLENIFHSPDIQKQLPIEQKKFSNIDVNFRKLMKNVSERTLALPIGTQPNLCKDLKEYNVKLEQIQKALEDYLDKKRKQFPRFFFLSNDELLEILAQAKVPSAVQPHLRKIFESVYQLDFGSESRGEDIYAMISAEGERIPLSRNLKARGSVEE